MDRFCASCGNAMPSMSFKKTCVDCRIRKDEQKEKDKWIRQTREWQTKVESWKDIGYVLVHSCLGNVDDKSAIEFCLCKKFVLKAKANKMVVDGLAVDLESRRPMFVGRDIVLKKALRTPRSASLERTHLERAWASSNRVLRERSVEELQALVAEDKQCRAQEERLRITLYGQVNADALNSLVRLVPEDEYDALQRSMLNVPVIQGSPIGMDERTPGCHGVNSSWSATEEDENDATYITEEIQIEEIESEISEDTDGSSEDEDDRFIRESGEQLAAEGD